MTRGLIEAAAIVTLAVPVLIAGAWVYSMLTNTQNEDLSKAGMTSLGFIFGSLANKAWES